MINPHYNWQLLIRELNVYMTQEEIAELMGISLRTVGNYLKDHVDHTYEKITFAAGCRALNLAQAYGIDVSGFESL